MGSSAVASKAETIANLIDGKVIDDAGRVAVCVRGFAEGFPATMEAIYPNWPFGVIYTVETNPVSDPTAPPPTGHSMITITPRVGRGLTSILTRIFLFESSGSPIGDKRLEKSLIFSYDERSLTERFIHYPGVADNILNLESIAKFNELIFRFGVGIYLAQPASFNSLDFDVARNTFATLGQLAKVMNEAF